MTDFEDRQFDAPDTYNDHDETCGFLSGLHCDCSRDALRAENEALKRDLAALQAESGCTLEDLEAWAYSEDPMPTIGRLRNEVADLRAENEALKGTETFKAYQAERARVGVLAGEVTNLRARLEAAELKYVIATNEMAEWEERAEKAEAEASAAQALATRFSAELAQVKAERDNLHSKFAVEQHACRAAKVERDEYKRAVEEDNKWAQEYVDESNNRIEVENERDRLKGKLERLIAWLGGSLHDGDSLLSGRDKAIEEAKKED